MSAARGGHEAGGPWRLLRDNGLSLALFGLFLVCLAAQGLTGWRAYDASLRAAHMEPVGFGRYLLTGTFQNAAFSNWQAAVLQLAVLVSFSSVLRQRGAAHSRKSAGEMAGVEARAPPASRARSAPPPRRTWLSRNSLSVTMFALFAAAFVLHAWTSNRAYNEAQVLRRLDPQALWPYLASADLWFDTFATWEAEFLAIGLYIVLTIFLRQEHSPQSKRMGAADAQTGDTNE